MEHDETIDGILNGSHIGVDSIVVVALRNEIDSLNSLLAQSADALNRLSEKFQEERIQKSKLQNEIAGMEEDMRELMAENQHLRTEMKQLKSQINLSKCNTDTPLLNETYLEPVEDFVANKLKAAQSEVTSLLKAHAEVMCDSLVEAETDLMHLLARFPGVDFEKKESEIDPYASTKGWVGRNSRSHSAFDTDSPGGISAHSAATGSSAAGYLFGSPSERFPILDQSTLSELDEEGSGEEDASEGFIESDSTGSTDSRHHYPINVHLDSIHAWSSEDNILRENEDKLKQ